MTYASGTEVSVDRSKAEVERLLRKYGATKFLSGWDDRQVVVGFSMNDRQVKISIPIPSKDDDSVRMTPSGRYIRSEAILIGVWQGAVRQRWRALVLILKAKLEAVSAGITTFESEFLGQLVLPGSGGRTVAEMVLPHLDDLPLALPAPTVDVSREESP